MSYNPKPFDNSDIHLPPEFDSLVETLARNNHELWAAARLKERWTFGPERDDTKRKTPLLIPYDQLPASEKEIDVNNAIEPLKTIMKLGWKIEPPPSTGGAALPTPNAAAVRWIPNRVPPPLYNEYVALGKEANEKGQSLLACDIANEGLKFWRTDAALLQIKALALARMGSFDLARDLLADLIADGDEETAGISARTFKDLWLRTGSLEDLRQARDNYLKAYQSLPERYWTGINAATLSWELGEDEKASHLAAEILAVCRAALSKTAVDEYWLKATIAEAALVQAACIDMTGTHDAWKTVESLYADARKVAANRFGNLFSTWRNARIVLRHLPRGTSERVKQTFRVPCVAVFAGHRVDSPGRTAARFRPEIVGEVKQGIKAELQRLNVGVGFATAASGSDILFLEALRELGGQTHVLMPCREDDFISQSVSDSGSEWLARHRAVKETADEIIYLSHENAAMGGLTFQYAADVLDGLATMRAAHYETELLRIAVWDGHRGDGPGGTFDTISRWRDRGCEVQIIPLPKADAEPSADRVHMDLEARHETAGMVAEVRSMIFADVKHFSRLSEEQAPLFIRGFIGVIAAQSRKANPPPEFQNTWGDGFFFVFANAGDAARFAVRLRDAVPAARAAGLPEDMNLRIALHAGPVFRFQDQLINRPNFIGSHVNRAARIEPVTAPGRIYATEAFAALATLTAPGQFRFDYVGKVALAKDFGTYALYDIVAEH